MAAAMTTDYVDQGTVRSALALVQRSSSRVQIVCGGGMLAWRRLATPKLLFARPPADAEEERKIRKLAGSRHAPGDWIMRAKMIVASWEGERTSAIAAELGCHMQTVRERLQRFNDEGLDGLGDRPGAGRKRRITEAERGRIIALARAQPPGRPQRTAGGDPVAADEAGPPQ
jgi:hypothetical protein